MKDIKEPVTTIAGLIMAICAPLTGAGIVELLPKDVAVICIIITGVCGGVIGFFNGRKANGKKKTTEQVKANVVFKSGIDTTTIGPAGDATKPGSGINPPPST